MNHDTATCSRCGYELTGLGQRGQCPECGLYFDHLTSEGVGHPATGADRTRFWLDKHLRTTTIAVLGGLLLAIFTTLLVLAGVAAGRSFPLVGVLTAAWLLIVLASYFEET